MVGLEWSIYSIFIEFFLLHSFIYQRILKEKQK